MRLSIFSIVIILTSCSSIPDEDLNAVYLEAPLEIVLNSQERFVKAQAILEEVSARYKKFIISNKASDEKNDRLTYIELLRNLVNSYNEAESILKEYPNSIANLEANWEILDRIISETFK